MFNRVLSNTERLRLEAYLASKYGIAGPATTLAASVTKNGTGIVTLFSNYPFVAPTTVNAGTLVAAHPNAATTAAATTVNSGAFFLQQRHLER